ncbi:hypothetical protein VQ574_21560 (plasmid) [Stutzerimonas frequens]|uniref:hypothetical protein n=1 Tax=Stutzerimonas frequens TaxID=2968969 RepID=UPI002DB81C07|nr:hypothetical protein [Stutzerimonas frequens]WRW29315.1 hypothetical protein VQ574_21560 [Stutzerimonas frequens]
MSATAKRFAIRSTLEVTQGNEGAYPHFWNFTAWRGVHPDCLLTQEGADKELARLQKSLPHDHTLMIFDVVEYREAIKIMRAVRQILVEVRIPDYDNLPREVRQSAEYRATWADINAKARAAAIAAGYNFV